jgi:hypothetical protein
LHAASESFPDLRWLRHVENPEDLLELLVSCTVEFGAATSATFGMLTEDKRQQLLALRGLLGHNVLEHCLQKRHKVQFGTTERYCVCSGLQWTPRHPLLCFSAKMMTDMLSRTGNRRTQLAVPYRACDVPSERAEFKHPDVAIVLTHLCYYRDGLSVQDMVNALDWLLQLPPSRQETIYRFSQRLIAFMNRIF